MKKYFWLIFSLLLISRLFFLAHYPYFYDSPEYYRESLSSNFGQSIVASHEAVHPLYLFLTQIFQKVSLSLTGQPQVWVISLISALFGILGILAWYFLVKRLFNDKIAIFSLIPLIFFPYLWLIQTNILHETVEQGLFLLGLLFLDLSLGKRKIYWVILVVISWALAIFNFPGILVWFPAAIGLILYRSKRLRKDLGIFFLSVFLSLGLALAGLYATLALAIPEPVVRMRTLLLGEGGVLFSWTLLDILRVLRNDFLILFYGYSIAAILGGIIAFVWLIRQKKFKTLIFLSLFIASFAITGKFWYGGLYGRWSALVVYPLALLLALVPWRKIYWGLMVILVISFLPTFLAYQKPPIPEIQAELVNQSSITREDLLILSDYQRPQLPYDNALYIVGANQKMVEEEIEMALKENHRVFISQQAITFPYWQYDGQEIHIISRGNSEKAHLKKFLEDKELELISEDKNYPLLSIYQIE
ncbi:glycosyltransferase family 39 protein [Patescibacteria group bacterium]|nr:glycosyltransferase family 39 protein [Patescibacteria group bacterium]